MTAGPGVRVWANAQVVTLDPGRPRVEALVSDGEILTFAGTTQEARKVGGPGAEVIDLGGRAVVPGFNDNHLHLVIHGDHAYSPDLTGLNETQIIDRLRAFAETEPGTGPLVGYAWDYPSCPHPSKEILDRFFPQRPVILPQFGGHAQWVNSVVLKTLGIDRNHNPAQGIVLRDPSGEPTGILREMAGASPLGARFHDLFYKEELREPRIRRALDEYRKVGITSVQDNSWQPPVVHTLAKLRKTNELTARVSCWSLGREPSTWNGFARGPFVADWVRPGPRKFFLDGTFTTRTAWMTEEYPGYPGDKGMVFDPQWLETILEQLARENLQGAFHSIGDRSTEVFLDVWQKVVSRHPGAVDLRMRLEHAQVVRPGDLPRLRDLGVCVAAQPPALDSPEKDISLLGTDRALHCYPHRQFLDAGVPLSFGSDIPGEGFFSPLRGIHLVCNRPGPGRLAPLDALKAYTQGSAYVEFQEYRKGTLKPGYLADFAVLSADLTAVPPGEISEIRVLRTVVGGQTRFP